MIGQRRFGEPLIGEADARLLPRDAKGRGRAISWMIAALMAAVLGSAMYVMGFLGMDMVYRVIGALALTLLISWKLKLNYALGAIVGLLHDVLITLGLLAMMGKEIDLNIIAALMTLVGYSLNDTIIVYDRIRENRSLMGKKSTFEELVNHSVNQSARRTVITTVTTVMALGVMCIVAKLYGLDSIFTFAFPLMMGMISGVYTSLCVSTSAWVLWSERSKKKN